MPTYEYECKSCSHNFEVFQSMSDPPLKDCPVCGKEVRRLIFGGSGVIFKGSGFYVTDKGKAGGGSKSAAPKAGSDNHAASSKSEAGKAETGKAAGEGSASCGNGGSSSGGEKSKTETKTA